MTAVSEKIKSNGVKNGNSDSSREITVAPDVEEIKETVKETVTDAKEKVETKAAQVGEVIKANVPDTASISSVIDSASTLSSPESPSPSPAPAKTQPVEIKKKSDQKQRGTSPPPRHHSLHLSHHPYHPLHPSNSPQTENVNNPKISLRQVQEHLLVHPSALKTVSSLKMESHLVKEKRENGLFQSRKIRMLSRGLYGLLS
jgi:hypothetical protein